MHTRNCLRHPACQLHFRAQQIQIRRRRFSLDPIIEKIARGHDAFYKFLFSFPPNDGIRIFARRHFGNSYDQIVLKQCVQRALGRFVPRLIRIETKDDFVDETF